MVAAESAAAGCPPVVADHSGLASVADGLDESYPPALRGLVRFPNEDADALRERLTAVLALGPDDRCGDPRGRARQAAVELWSWRSVAQRIAATV